MTTREPSEALRQFIRQHDLSLDHVALLPALREGSAAHSPAALAAQSRLDQGIVERALGDLAAWRLLRRDGHDVTFDPPVALRQLVDELTELYRTMPVTLVRMICARPAR